MLKIKSDSCPNTRLIVVTCHHFKAIRKTVPCWDKNKCSYCAQKWRGIVRAKITKGMEIAPKYGWKFLTLTWKGGIIVEEFLDAWKRLQKTWSEKWPGYKCFRVLEIGTKGRLHLHAVADVPLETYKSIGHKQRLLPWKATLRTAVIKQQEWIKRYGFGDIQHCESVRNVKHGPATYLSKYLAKEGTAKRIELSSGRSARIAEGTRNWNFERKRPRGLTIDRHGIIELTEKGISVKANQCECGYKGKSLIKEVDKLDKAKEHYGRVLSQSHDDYKLYYFARKRSGRSKALARSREVLLGGIAWKQERKAWEAHLWGLYQAEQELLEQIVQKEKAISTEITLSKPMVPIWYLNTIAKEEKWQDNQ